MIFAKFVKTDDLHQSEYCPLDFHLESFQIPFFDLLQTENFCAPLLTPVESIPSKQAITELMSDQSDFHKTATTRLEHTRDILWIQSIEDTILHTFPVPFLEFQECFSFFPTPVQFLLQNLRLSPKNPFASEIHLPTLGSSEGYFELHRTISAPEPLLPTPFFIAVVDESAFMEEGKINVGVAIDSFQKWYSKMMMRFC